MSIAIFLTDPQDVEDIPPLLAAWHEKRLQRDLYMSNGKTIEAMHVEKAMKELERTFMEIAVDEARFYHEEIPR